MSEYHGFKCDKCGTIFSTGIRMSGDKKAEVQCGRSRHAYRFDLCNECYDEFMAFCKVGKKSKKHRLYDAMDDFVEAVKQADNETDQREVCRLVNNAIADFRNRKIAIEEIDE